MTTHGNPSNKFNKGDFIHDDSLEKDTSPKLGALHVQIEILLKEINEIEAKIDRYEFFNNQLGEKTLLGGTPTIDPEFKDVADLTPKDINKLQKRRDELVDLKNPLEAVYDALWGREQESHQLPKPGMS